MQFYITRTSLFLISQLLDLLISVSADCLEQLVYVGTVLRADLEERHPVIVGQLSTSFLRNRARFSQVALVAHQKY